MVGELLREIMNTIGVQTFNFDLEETTDRLKDFLHREKYFVFIARDEGRKAVGFLATRHPQLAALSTGLLDAKQKNIFSCFYYEK